MATLKNKYIRAKALVEDWANKKGHDQCWYYPEVFRQLAEIFGVEYKNPELPPRREFNEFCERYEDEVFGARYSKHVPALPDYLL